MTCLRTFDDEALIFRIESLEARTTPIEVELARRLKNAVDQIERLQEWRDDHELLVDACYRRGICTSEELVAAIPLPKAPA